MQIPGSTRHIYPTDSHHELKTATPTYDAIVANGGNGIPEGKLNCIHSIHSSRAGSIFRLKLTTNLPIPPQTFIDIDGLKHKSGDELQRAINELQGSVTAQGFDPNQRSKIHHGGTLLHAAAAAYDVDSSTPPPTGLMAALLANGHFNRLARDDRGQTALHVAAKAGSLEAVQALLLDSSAAASIEDSSGKIPLRVAIDAGEKADTVRAEFYNPRYGLNYGGWIPHVLQSLTITSGNAEGHIKGALRRQALDPNYRFSDEQGQTILHLAALNCRDHTVQTVLLKMLLKDKRIIPNAADDNGQTALHVAAAQNSLHIIRAMKELLRDRRIDVNRRDHQGKTPLLVAAESGTHDSFKMLINHQGVDVAASDNDGRNLLHHLAANQNPISTQILNDLLSRLDMDVNARDNGGRTPLLIAAGAGREDTFNVLRNHPDIDLTVRDNDGKNVLHYYVLHGAHVLGDLLSTLGTDTDMRDNSGCTPLHAAVDARNSLAVRTLLTHDSTRFNVADNQGLMPLHTALLSGEHDIISEFLRVRNIDLNVPDQYQDTPLHYAVRSNRPDRVMLLLQSRSVNANAQNSHGRTPLILAAQERRTRVVGLLLRHYTERVDVNLSDESQRSALHWAAANNHAPIVQWLLAHPAINVDAQDASGRTARQIAESNRPTSSETLEAFGVGPRPREWPLDDQPGARRYQQGQDGGRTGRFQQGESIGAGARMTSELAIQTLNFNVEEDPNNLNDVNRAYRRASLAHHPDRVMNIPGITEEEVNEHMVIQTRLNAAVEFLRTEIDRATS